MPETVQVLSRVAVGDDDDCWPWQGNIQPEGYGRIYLRGRKQYAHRVVFEMLGGRIPEGLEIDHLCRNRRCVNPQHLDPVTRKENIARSPIMWHAARARRTHCQNGHEFTPENTRPRQDGTGRRCLTCKRESSRRSRKRRGDFDA